MAVINSLAIGKARGSMGNITYKVRGGLTIGSQKQDKVVTSRTFRQMLRRTQWANLVNFWQALGGVWHPSFIGRNKLVSDFNLFMRANLGQDSVYLTKEQARLGATIASAIKVTEGTLPSIDAAQGTGGVIVSDLEIGQLTIDGDTTLAGFSQAVILNNADWANGDQLTALVVRQHTNPTTSIPYVTIEVTEVTLNSADEETLLVDLLGESDAFTNVGGKLGMAAAVNGGVAYVHSRIDADGQTICSTEVLAVTNSLAATYQTATARDAAIKSYGGNLTAELLTPNIDYTAAPVTP